jgi:hypothetical protein
LSAMSLRLGDDVLDQIDEIVPPGTDVYAPQDGGAKLPWLADPALRRRAPR